MQKCYDHKGIAYQSHFERAKTYGKHPRTIRDRLAKGWTLEDALTIETGDMPQRYRNGHTCQDHLGNIYKSKKERAKAYGKSPKRIERRLDNGWTIEEALTIEIGDMPQRYRNGHTCQDHLGNIYKSKTERAKAYGKSPKRVEARLDNGWTIEEALTIEIGENKRRAKTCKDHLGNIYKSKTERAKAYGKPSKTVRDRLDKGWTLRAALIIPSKLGVCIAGFNQRCNKVLFNIKGKEYKNFSCPICGNSYVFDYNDVLTHILFHIEKRDDI